MKKTLIIFSLFVLTIAGCKKEKNGIAPVACITISPDTAPVNTPIQFTSCSQHAGSVLWNFGDGTSSTSASVSKEYENPGTYTVTLTVTNTESGKTDSKQAMITITSCPPGYEGANCAVISRLKFLGSYNASESSQFGNYTYTLSITSGSSINQVILNSISDDFFANTVYGTIDGNILTIPNQEPDNDGYTINGSGTLNGNNISVIYTLSDGMGDTENLNGIWVRN